jgi:hypothetical protein
MENRRNFIKKIIAGTMVAPLSKLYAGKSKKRKYLIDNPYEGINWSRFQQIDSTTHVHITDQQKLDKICQNLKLKHIPISNYYPSTPYYPPDKILRNQFMVRQEFGTMYDPDNKGKDRFKKGKYINGPLEWNKIIMHPETGWYDNLPEERKKQMPFEEKGPLFANIPEGVIFSPSSEQHTYTNSGMHACAVGSLYSSGTFDAHDEFQTKLNGYCAGNGLPWEEVFKRILDQLLFEDAGGITINHPVWSYLSFDEIAKMLDFDPRVLGIEIYNDLCATGYGDPNKGWGLKFWDQALSSGRRCLGFCVPDHTVGKGKNILLVPKFNEHECLKAYRKGAFFGVVLDNGLRFTNIELKQNTLLIETNRNSTIRLATNKGEAFKKAGRMKYEYEIPLNSEGQPDIMYIRIEAWDEESAQIFSQPIRFLPA